MHKHLWPALAFSRRGTILGNKPHLSLRLSLDVAITAKNNSIMCVC